MGVSTQGEKHGWKTALTDSDASAKEEVGIIRIEIDATGKRKKYKYVQFDGAVGAAGEACCYSDIYNVDAAVAHGAAASQNRPAGVTLAAHDDDDYGWIQIGGYHATVATDGDDDISAGDNIILSTTTDVVDSVPAGTAPTHTPLGVATTDDVGDDDTVAVQLNCPE